ncbi:MAG: hypothetical protein AAGI01_07805 [Myxococcota bacterium]
MVQGALDELIELQTRLGDLEHTRADMEGTYDDLLDAERRRIVTEISEMLDALLTAYGYASDDISKATITWHAEHAEGDAPKRVTVSMPSKFEGNYLLYAQVDAGEGAVPRARFIIDHPAFAALKTDIDNDTLDTVEFSCPSFRDTMGRLVELSESAQHLDLELYEARVAELNADIAATEAAISALDARISSFEADQPYALVRRVGDTVHSVSDLLDVLLKG